MKKAGLAFLVIAAGGLVVACGGSGGASGGSGGTSGGSGGASGGSGGASGGAAGASGGSGGASGGAAGASGGAGGGTGGGGNPACASADSHGFFSSCSACADPGNCDTIDVGGSSRQACGCNGSSDCPCGFSCGCYQIAPNVNTCGICVR